MFLLDSGIVKRLVLEDRSTQSKAGAETSKRWLAGLSFEWIASIECAVLCKEEGVAVNGVCPGTSDDVNRTSRGSSRLCGKVIVDHLKFLHDFGRELGAARTRVLVVVVEAIDRNIVAA